MPQHYRNEYLFSEIYLKEITEILEAPNIKAEINTLKENREYANSTSLAEWNKSFVHETLNALQFGLKKIDDHLALLFTPGAPEKYFSLCYCLLPTEKLDNSLMGQNWAEKIVHNLRKYDLKWGILTNGDLWRIYHTDEAMPYENYLEIDLESVLNTENIQQFQIFHKFMKAENFSVNEEGICQFDIFKQESQKKIDYIEDELKKALKQKEEDGKGVLSSLCMGYIEYLRSNGTTDFSEEKQRDIIYHSAMLYMFRMLFLFYANARGLLTDNDSDLFSAIVEKAKIAQEKKLLKKDSIELWDNFRTIFSNIELTYDGGLFDPKENDFIENNRISDYYLAPAIYYMTYYKDKSGNFVPISYRDMGVRHLGTLYEGLIEHKLFVAEEDTEVRISKKQIEFIKQSEGGKIEKRKYVAKGNVYFGTDKKSRKASGSYYTPEYIVDCIVKNTVGERLKELKEEFLKDEQKTIQLLQTAIHENEKQSFIELLETRLKEFVNKRILKLSVLDPAMGSGHFLVNATNLITNFTTEIFNELDIIAHEETAPKYWRRRIVENCIYGVDINPLAVELAKLSLWILSMAKDEPLSFLNHHLKCGNSLIGALLEDVGEHPKKKIKENYASLFDQNKNFRIAVDKAIDNYKKIEVQESKELTNIGEKQKWLEEIKEILNPFVDVCNFHISAFFDDDISEEDYNINISNFNEYFEWNSDYYFHWQLEFPEVLLNRKGFDIVIGNPPYVKARESDNYKKITREYLNNCGHYKTLYKMWDLYIPFVERSIFLLDKNARFSMILPDTIEQSEYSKNLREFIINNFYIYQIDFFPNSKIFISDKMPVGIRNTIIYIKNTNQTSNKTLRFFHKDNYQLIEKIENADHNINIFKKRDYKIDLNKVNTISLGEICFTSYGLRLNSDKNDPNFSFKKSDLLSKNRTNIHTRKYTEGKFLGNHKILNSLWVEWNTERCPNHLVRPTFPELYEPEKLLLGRQTHFAVYDDEKHIVDNTIIVCIPYSKLRNIKNRNLKKYFSSIKKPRKELEKISESYNLLYILGILNSNLIKYYIKNLKQNTIDMYPDDWKKIPIPLIIDNDNDFKIIYNDLILIVKQIINIIKRSKENDKIKDIDSNNNLEILNDKINMLVYQLYDLNNEEIKTIEERLNFEYNI